MEPIYREEVFGHEAYKERRLPDEVLANFETTPLPEDAVVTHLLIASYRGERPVLAWHDGRLTLPAGDVKPGEALGDAINRLLLEQIGVLRPVAAHLGHFRCRATVHSKNQAPGTVTYRAYYAAQIGELVDFPSDPAYERRIVLQRDLNNVLRTEYAEYQREYMETLDNYVLELRKQAAQST
jgi:ADP-ribose pyrophosphatase YjhB (NUDIX family)